MPYRDPLTGRFARKPTSGWRYWAPAVGTAGIGLGSYVGKRYFGKHSMPKYISGPRPAMPPPKSHSGKKKAMPKSEFYGKALGKYRYAKRRKISKKAAKRTLRGLQYTKESVGTATSLLGQQSNPAYIGHFTMPYNLVLQNIFRTLIRALYSKKGFNIQDFNLVVPNEFVGDVISLQGYENGQDTTIQTIGTDTVGIGDTFEVVALNLYTSFDSARTAIANYGQIYFQLVRVDHADGSFSEYPMSNVWFDIYVKSSLKVQNRTLADDFGVSTDTFDSTNIAANPVNGKLYYGYGAAPQLKGRRGVVLTGQGSQGLVTTGPTIAGPVNGWEEPPQPAQLTRCNGSSKLVLAPGGIKTSILTQKYKIGFNSLMRKYFSQTGGIEGTTGPGKFALMSLEKMMNETESPVVTLTYELNHFMNTDCFIKANRTTNPINDV